MKKSFLKFFVLLATFSIGFTTFKVFSFDKNHEAETALNAERIPPIFLEKPAFGKGNFALPNAELNSEDFVSDENAEKDDFNGWYALDNAPKNMKEVTMIALSKDNYDEPKSYGGVFTTFENYGDQGHFGSAFALINGDEASFRTEKINGIEYEFEGKFFKEKMPKKEGEKVLRGTLRKFVNGKKVAQVTGNFGYYEPHCWH